MAASCGKILPIVLAGGAGIRLWPLSQVGLPKQFIALNGKASTYQATLQRLADPSLFLPPLIVVNRLAAEIAKNQAAEIGCEARFVVEPFRRDSAAAILAATLLAEEAGFDGPIAAIASDHLVSDVQAFRDDFRQAAAWLGEADIVTFGIAPTEPLSSYGYIEPGEPLDGGLRRVLGFIEKPSREIADALLAKGCLWNSGNLVFRGQTLLKLAAMRNREILEPVRRSLSRAERSDTEISLDAAAFGEAIALSIDIAILETASNLVVLPAHFDWADIGDWQALAALGPRDALGNVVNGRAYLHRSRGCFVHSDRAMTAIVGLDNLTVVANGNKLLIASREALSDIKAVVAEIEMTQTTEDAERMSQS